MLGYALMRDALPRCPLYPTALYAATAGVPTARACAKHSCLGFFRTAMVRGLYTPGGRRQRKHLPYLTNSMAQVGVQELWGSAPSEPKSRVRRRRGASVAALCRMQANLKCYRAAVLTW